MTAPTADAETAPPDLEALDGWLGRALSAARDRGGDDRGGAAWLDAACAELAGGDADGERFARLISQASRYAPRGPLLADDGRLESELGSLSPGTRADRWTALEAARVRLVVALARAEARHGGDLLPDAIEEAFRFADEGELCALYRSLQFLPRGERFLWRAAEGCRTNMKSVFEANGCDTTYPARHFDGVAWRQLCMKALFIESPLWRVVGFDERVDGELARMALDLVEERRSAGRRIFPELWMCLGTEPDERALASLETEISGDDELSRKGAILALGRLGQTERLTEIERDGGSVLGPVAQWALMGRHDRAAYAAISPPEGASPETS